LILPTPAHVTAPALVLLSGTMLTTVLHHADNRFRRTTIISCRDSIPSTRDDHGCRPKKRSCRSESSARSDDGSSDASSGTSSSEEADSDASDEAAPRGRQAAAAQFKPAARGGRAASYADGVEAVLAERTNNGVQEFHVKWKGEHCLGLVAPQVLHVAAMAV